MVRLLVEHIVRGDVGGGFGRAILVAAGIIRASFRSPSRGPTSTRRTYRGNAAIQPAAGVKPISTAPSSTSSPTA